ncbi:MAG: IclR family transcriptional regulator, regulon repressor [Thermoanaerobacteraceae bacterium]|jgi:IclR family acetate operon transcriptional repressor|nr:IclR family transcriptional regulator, regulon repressor [Thermoanaerobacteraceae bacterium]RKL61849.1 IclR family transcriptional regulator [Thermoanaerobacteraceae bacterium SP2]
MPQDNTVQSIERAINILEELAEEKEGLGVTELSRRLNLHKSTVHRLLSTLLSLGYVEQNPYSEKYRLGIKLLHLGGAILERMDLRKEAHDLLKELSDEVNEAVHLVVPDGNRALYIDKIDSSRTIRMYSQIGRRAPMHASAVGKAILAFSSEDFVRKVIDEGLEKYTSNTITDPGKLVEHLKTVRARGFAVDDEENEEGIRCVGAPIFDYSGRVIGALSISGATVTVTPDKVKILAARVKEYAAKISRRMGWPLNK